MYGNQKKKILVVYDAESNWLLCNDKYEAEEQIKSEILEQGYNMREVEVYKCIPLNLNISFKETEVDIEDVED